MHDKKRCNATLACIHLQSFTFIGIAHICYHQNKAGISGAGGYDGTVSSNSPRIGFARSRKARGLFFRLMEIQIPT
jgi:hypothetical protein